MSAQGRTNWAAIDALTEEEIMARALSDPDNLPLTEEDLARMPELPRVTFLCQYLQISAEEFSRRYCIPVDTIRSWETYSSEPDAAARAFLRAIHKDPDGIARALGTLPAEHPQAA